MDSKTSPSSPKEASVDLEMGGPQVPQNTKVQFTNLTERNVFIRKFYLLLICQLSTSAALTQLYHNVLSSLPLQGTPHGDLFWWMSVLVLILVMMVLFCLGDLLRSWPVDLLGLTLLTVAFAVFLSCTSGLVKVEGTMVTIFLVIMVLPCLITTTFVPKVDFTAGLVMFPLVICIVLTFSVSLHVLFLGHFSEQCYMTLLFSIIAAVVFCSYIVLKTQEMVLDNHESHIKPHEFVYATIIIYTDVFNLLFFVLTLVVVK